MSMQSPRPTLDLSAGSRMAVEEAFASAIARGGGFTGTTAEEERTCSAQDLLCMAGDVAVDAALLAQAFEAAGPDGDRERMLREAVAGMARLTMCALEVHARDNGYDPVLWSERARDETNYLLFDDCDALFDGAPAKGESVVLARRAASCVMSALACAPADRMGVPGHVADALGTCVALFMIADGAVAHG